MMQCATPTMFRCRMNSCAAWMVCVHGILAGLNKAGYRLPHTLHGRALQNKMPLIMRSMPFP